MPIPTVPALLALLLVTTLVSPSRASATAPDFALDEIASGVFVHRGHYADIEEPTRGDSANIGFVVGARCVAVIDSGGSVATGRALRDAIAARSGKPVCYVINTHAHFDHVLGNAAFLDSGAEFVGHSNLASVLAASRDYFLERFADELKGAPAPVVIEPSIAIETTRELDLGRRTLRLTAHPEAHSAADLTVLDESTETLWAGDLLFVERLPVLDGKLVGWEHWMTAAAGTRYARVVPGHGPTSVTWPAGLEPQQAYFSNLRAQVQQALAAGDFLEDVIAAAAAAPPAAWQIPAAHGRNAGRIYRELEWE